MFWVLRKNDLSKGYGDFDGCSFGVDNLYGLFLKAFVIWVKVTLIHKTTIMKQDGQGTYTHAI